MNLWAAIGDKIEEYWKDKRDVLMACQFHSGERLMFVIKEHLGDGFKVSTVTLVSKTGGATEVRAFLDHPTHYKVNQEHSELFVQRGRIELVGIHPVDSDDGRVLEQY